MRCEHTPSTESQLLEGVPESLLPGTVKIMHRHSRSRPRLINILCDTALVYPYAEKMANVDGRTVLDVVKD